MSAFSRCIQVRRKMKVNEIRELEKKYKKELEELKKELIQELDNIEYTGIKLIQENIVIVNSSSLKESWLPSYHIPKKQTKEIAKRIEKTTSLSQIEKLLEKLREEKKVNKQVLTHNLIKKISDLEKELKEGK